MNDAKKLFLQACFFNCKYHHSLINDEKLLKQYQVHNTHYRNSPYSPYLTLQVLRKILNISDNNTLKDLKSYKKGHQKTEVPAMSIALNLCYSEMYCRNTEKILFT